MFLLVVDDFGIKYTRLQHATYLLDTLKNYFELSIDWSGTLFCGIALTWDYKNDNANLTLPNNITKTLNKFQHPQ